MLLHQFRRVLAFDAQQPVGRVRAVRAAATLPIATLEMDRADRRDELPSLRPFVFLLPSTGTAPQRSPFFSAASSRRATAALSI
jgi:hypothetical protein